jgi:hypothetical protein
LNYIMSCVYESQNPHSSVSIVLLFFLIVLNTVLSSSIYLCSDYMMLSFPVIETALTVVESCILLVTRILSSLARTLWSWVRMPLRAWMFRMYVSLFCV